MGMTIDDLLKTSYWVIDILPSQVPKDGPGQYFAVEKYFLDEKRLAAIKEKHIDLVLKLNCYRRIAIDGGAANPAPELVAAQMRERYLYIMVDEAMILSEPDDTHLTIFNPDAALLELVREIAAGEGLYVWKPPFDGRGIDKVSLVTFSPTGSSMAAGRLIADTMAAKLMPKPADAATGLAGAEPGAAHDAIPTAARMASIITHATRAFRANKPELFATFATIAIPFESLELAVGAKIQKPPTALILYVFFLCPATEGGSPGQQRKGSPACAGAARPRSCASRTGTALMRTRCWNWRISWRRTASVSSWTWYTITPIAWTPS